MTFDTVKIEFEFFQIFRFIRFNGIKWESWPFCVEEHYDFCSNANF